MACRCVGIVVRTSSRGSTLSVIFRRGTAPRDGRTRQLIFPQAYHWGQLRDPLPSWIRILSRYNYKAQPPATVPPLPEVADKYPRQVPAAEASRPISHMVCAQLAAHVPSQPKDWLRFASQPEAQQVLRRFCGVCGQWLANIRSAKLHYRSVHSAIYEKFNTVAAADCKRVGHLVSPCSFCGAVVTRTDQHSAKCPVLWQARVCCLVTASASGLSCPATRHGRPLAMELDSESQGVFGNLLGKRPLQFDLEPTQTKFRHGAKVNKRGGGADSNSHRGVRKTARRPLRKRAGSMPATTKTADQDHPRPLRQITPSFTKLPRL